MCIKYKFIHHIVNNIRLTQNLTHVLRAWRTRNLIVWFSKYVVMFILLSNFVLKLNTNKKSEEHIISKNLYSKICLNSSRKVVHKTKNFSLCFHKFQLCASTKINYTPLCFHKFQPKSSNQNSKQTDCLALSNLPPTLEKT